MGVTINKKSMLPVFMQKQANAPIWYINIFSHNEIDLDLHGFH